MLSLTRDDNSSAPDLDVSVIVPFLNERESLQELYERVVAVMDKTGKSYEMILVDDGSTDGSGDLARDLAEKDPRVVLLGLKRNYGKSNALMVGFHAARGARAVTMDADLQDRPENIPLLLEHEDFDLVSGWRRDRRDKPLKKLLSKVFNALINFVFKVRVKDINCGFKAYGRDLYKTLNLYGDLHRMTLVLAHLEGYSFAEVPVEHDPRKHGKSKYPLFRARGLWDILSLAVMNSLTLRPFHFFAPYSVLLALVSVLLLIVLVVRAVFGDGGYSIWHTLLIISSLVSVTLFLAGLQFEASLNIYRRKYPYEKTVKRVVRQGREQ